MNTAPAPEEIADARLWSSSPSHDLFDLLLEESEDLIYFKDREGRYAVANQSAAAALGAGDRQELPGRREEEFLDPTLARRNRVEEQEVMATGLPFHSGPRQEDWPGERLWLMYSHRPWRDEEGRIRGTFTVVREVSALQRQTEALEQTASLLDALLRHAEDNLFFKDRQHRILKLSRSSSQRLGLTDPELAEGRTDADFFAREEAEAAHAVEDEIMRTGRPRLNYLSLKQWPDGRKRWLLSSRGVLQNEQGEVIGTFGIGKDVTELKEAEASLAEAHRKLLEASRLAGRAEVATGVLHNIGNVLTSVNVSATLVRDGLGQSRVGQLAKVAEMLQAHREDLAEFFTRDEKGRRLPDYLGRLAQSLEEERRAGQRECENLCRYIEHIREIVNLQQNYARAARLVAPACLRDLMEDALKINAAGLDRHRIRVERDYQPVPDPRIDAHQVLQILVNLISNAKYAMDACTGPRELHLAVRPAGPGQVALTVRDNGAGIHPEHLTRIFEHGFTTRQEGHGFGLHSSALAAQELGGSLRGDSAGPGCGATFTLLLPAAEESARP